MWRMWIDKKSRVLSFLVVAGLLLGSQITPAAVTATSLRKPYRVGHRVIVQKSWNLFHNVHVLAYAGSRWGSVRYGIEHPQLSRLAQNHANYMARVRFQGHQGWGSGRFQESKQVTGCGTASEICNESWPNVSIWEASLESWRAWKTSSGHWRTANGRPIFYGAAIARGSNGIWYSCIITAGVRGRTSVQYSSRGGVTLQSNIDSSTTCVGGT
jgi:hypothetical protein